MQFLFLNAALTNFITAIQTVWAPVFQQQGIAILLAISAIALAVYAIQLLFTYDVAGFILGFCYTILSLALLRAVFLVSQEFSTAVLNTFIQWGQLTSGMSPDVLTPSGIMETGLQLTRIFWAASGHASWFLSPISALEDLICTLVVILAFGFAAVIYLLALVEVWVLIISASVLLAFAALPWTWSIFPGWALTVLAACVKILFLLAVIALGLVEAHQWGIDMAAVSGTIADNFSLLFQVTVEALLFVAAIYYVPNLMASMIVGGAGSAIHAGEALLGGVAGAGAGAAAEGAIAGANAARGAAAAGAQGAISGASKVASMLLR